MFSRTISFARTKLSRSPFTVTGRLLTISGIFCCFAIFDTTLTKLLSYVMWLLIVGFCCGVLFRPSLKVKPGQVSVVFNGHSFDVQLQVTNCGRLGAYDLRCTLELPQEGLRARELTKTISSLAPSETVTINYSLDATKRGVFELKRLAVASLFPLSLFRFLAIYPVKQTIPVAPNYDEQQGVIGEIVEGLDQSEYAGNTKMNSLLEYIGSREFRPGVPVRRWDFASWARLGTPSVREFSEGSDSIVVVVVDTARRTKAIDPTLEATLSTATGVLVQLDAMGQSIFMISVGKEIEFGEVRAASGQLGEFLIRLAGVKDASTKIDWANAWDQILLEIPNNAALVAILSDADASTMLSQTNLGSRKVVTCPVAQIDRQQELVAPVLDIVGREPMT